MPRPSHPNRPAIDWLDCVYGLRAPRSRHIRYVGSTNSPSSRWSCHLSEARTAAHRGNERPKDRWINNLLDRGSAPILVVLEVVRGRRWGTKFDRLAERERVWIRRLARGPVSLLNHANTGYPSTNKACGVCGERGHNRRSHPRHGGAR